MSASFWFYTACAQQLVFFIRVSLHDTPHTYIHIQNKYHMYAATQLTLTFASLCANRSASIFRRSSSSLSVLASSSASCLYVCMWCICVCVSAPMVFYGWIDVCIYVCVHTKRPSASCMYVCMHCVCVCVSVANVFYACMHVFMYLYVCMYACMYACMCAHKTSLVNVFYAWMDIFMYLYVWMYVCMYVCMYGPPYKHVNQYEHESTLIFIMTVFFFLDKKNSAQILEPKRTGSVFVLSVQYQYSFVYAKKKTIIMKTRVYMHAYQHMHCKNATLLAFPRPCASSPPPPPFSWQPAHTQRE